MLLIVEVIGKNITRNGKRVEIPQLNIRQREKLFIDNVFTCHYSEPGRCDKILKSLRTEFVKKVFPATDRSQFFNQPSSIRTMMGMFDLINSYAENYASSVYMDMVHTQESIGLLLNCPKSRVEEITEEFREFGKDKFEITMSKNFVDFMIPQTNEELEKFDIVSVIKKYSPELYDQMGLKDSKS